MKVFRRNPVPGVSVSLVILTLLGVTPPLAAAAPGGSCTSSATPSSVLPGDPGWASSLNPAPRERNFGTAAITGANPRSGTGSLEITTSGRPYDWAFYQRLAGAGAWGLLSSVNCVSFDWNRATASRPDQTPVLRLLIRDFVNNQLVNSELVWDGGSNPAGPPVSIVDGQWNVAELTGQQFRREVGGLCANGSARLSGLESFDLNGWGSSCYSLGAEVYGIMIGLGGNSPGSYHAFLDNVQLGFKGAPGLAVQDNFELNTLVTVAPEPSSIVLLGTGFALVLGLRIRRRRGT